MTDLQDRICGAVLASALADAFGAPFEGGPLERLLWRILGKRHGKRRWTDDTQMSVDVMESLLACERIDQRDLALRFARSYRWTRGYGPSAGKLLKRIRRGEAWQIASRAIYPNGSLGNGGAMRSAPIGLFYGAERERRLVRAVREATVVTHAHPVGQDGAVIISLTAALVCLDHSVQEIFKRLRLHIQTIDMHNRLNTAEKLLQAGYPVLPKKVASELGNGVRAKDSCVTAFSIGLALREAPFHHMLSYVRELGGDTDTIGAMAGAIWGASCGYRRLPEVLLKQLEQRKYLEDLAHRFADTVVRAHF
ncbi:MAG: ADP-ribosylglycohydrolase family protein [Candidatus Electrothrix aestuarii]|uniref:ADP-ribosylglycohydrolase family protein n=1 Tax=Candidatus Electrothrix aestuarii TaxID=3062594 RepID=A0AAU8LP67_9BACT|nr:ADP-ribosylglycohydrolase family protein [Candidatus Electrothrix aestuarii]